MIPLIFAAAAVLTGPIQHPFDAAAAPPLQKDLKAPFSVVVIPTAPNLQKDLMGGPPTLCKRSVDKAAAGPDGQPLKKLGDLPPGLEEHAVLRLINGCPVREIVYGGKTYYLDTPVASLDRVDPATFITKQR